LLHEYAETSIQHKNQWRRSYADAAN
jgi:hypothetical protein